MRRSTILVACVFWFFLAANAQQNMVMYHMKTLPQRQYANPALNPDSRLYFGVPAISSLQFNAAITAFRLKDFNSVLEKGPKGNTLNVTRLGDVLGKNNYFKINADAEILAFGFKAGKKHYFFANSTLRNQVRFQYPNGLFQFALQGNGGQNLGKTFNFGFGLDVLQYLETGIGWSYAINEKLTIGLRGKYLQGINNLHTESMDLKFYTDPNDYSWQLQSDIRIHAASSIAKLSVDDSLDLGFEFSGAEPLRFPLKNSGLGLDLGARYDLNDKISLSGSIIDLGYIKWDNNSVTLASKNPGATFRFEGVEVDNFFNDSTAFETAIRGLGDTLKDRFAVRAFENEYRHALFTEFYLGGNLNITENHNAGILFYGSVYNRKFYPAFTLSWNSKIRRILGVSVAWSYMNRSFANLGAGLTINAGPVQWYIVSDNFFSPIRPLAARTLDLRFGMNLTFLRKKKGDTDYEGKSKK